MKVVIRFLLRAWCCGCLAVSAWALDWQVRDGYRLAPVQPQGTGRPGFTRLGARDLGLTFTNWVNEERTMTNRNLASGSGVALGDVDGDGWCDVFLCGIDVAPQLFRNFGQWKFSAITARAFPSGDWTTRGAGTDATGAAFADVDGDGDLDLLMNGLGRGTRLWRNDGTGVFQEITDEAGLRSRTGATSLALADVDQDGDLDLYVCNFRPDTVMDRPSAQFSVRSVGGRPVVTAVNGRPTTDPELTNRFELGPGGQVIEFGEPDVLWLNQGGGRFRAASWTDGTFLDESGQPLKSAPNDWGLAAHFGDLNGDGRVDLYVCNDLHTPDRLWWNVSTPGKPQFRAISRTALRNNSTFSMGVDFGDLNRDGFTDLFTVDMLGRERADRARQMAGLSPVFRMPGEFEDRVQLLRNALQLNRGDNTFAETGIFSGVEASDWSWGPIFLDVDLDGYEEILVTNGQLRDYQDSDGAERIAAAQAGGRTLSPAEVARLTRELPAFATPKVLFHNRTATRLTAAQSPVSSPVVPIFVDVAKEWGFATVGISQGAALADLDQDGDLDVVMNNLLDEPGVYRNDASAPRVAIRLRGKGANTRGIGASVGIRVAGQSAAFPVEQRQTMLAGSRYLSGDEPVRALATGSASRVTVDVRWPQGGLTRLEEIPANSVIEVEEPLQRPAEPAPVTPPAPWFQDVSERLAHRAGEEDFDDFGRQPLLPNKLSQLGPGASWADLNEDGAPDLIVGSGRSGNLAVWENDGKGQFKRLEDPMFQRPLGRDLTTVLPLNGVLVAGSSNWEDGQTNGGAVRLYDLASRRSGEAVLGVPFSVGPLAAADVTGDGALEIFVGGRARAGRWPEPVPSLLLRNDGGRLTVVQRLETMNRVSGACFTDADGDGDPDLVVAGDWGPLQLWKNDQGKLAPAEVTVEVARKRMPLSALSGLWNSVTTGDFDGDGRLDWVAGNWGLNQSLISALPTSDRPSLRGLNAEPTVLRRLYFGELGGVAGVDVVEALPGPDGDWPGRELPMWSRAFPWLRSEVPTYAAFGQSTVAKIFGERLARAGRLEVNWLASSVFLNRGDYWEVRALPDFAQLAPVLGVAVADADGDGTDDVFLAQNWFATDPLTPRQDSGRGLWLRGNGRGDFRADSLSGVAAYGEQRAAAVADFDRDGRPDLVLTQNAGATHIYRNATGRPGLAVSLQGPAENPHAIGASVRLVFGARKGPARELHLGAGYWSVDSSTLLLGQPEPAQSVEIRWPRGALTTSPIPAGARAVSISSEGKLSVLP